MFANRDATSAKQPMMTAIATAARTTATMLARPSRLAKTEGKPKTPLPMMQFTVSAAKLQRPMARTRPSLGVFSGTVSGIASLYHKYPIRCCFKRSVSWLESVPIQISGPGIGHDERSW